MIKNALFGLLFVSLLLAGCTQQPEPIVGGDEDEHGCKASAGYSWCELKQKCLRTWEEPCSEATVEGADEIPPLPE
ncbi:MAG: hypothetical protein V1834_04745 [Candidatus Micrarchaeota archaeon]